MENIFHFIKFFDTFGPSVNFTIRSETNFKTVLGGFISIIVYSLYIFFFVLFGKDMIFKSNPNINLEIIIPDNQEKYHIDKDFLFAWKIEDYYGSPLKEEFFKGYFSYNIYDNYLMNKLNTSYINFLNCKDEKFDRFFNKTIINRTNWSCLDYSELLNFPLWGTFNSRNYSYLYFELDICEVKNNSKSNCKDFKEVQKKLSDQVFFFTSLTYDVNFKPNNYEQPLEKKFNFIQNNLNLNLQKLDIYYFINTKVEQDDSLLFSNEVEIENLYYIDKIDKYSNFRLDKDLEQYYSNNEYNSSKNIYNSFFLLDKSYKKYSRKYLKIQDVFANVNGFMDFLILIFNLIKFYTNYRFDYFLFNEFVNVKVEKSIYQKNNILNTNDLRLNSKNNKNSKEMKPISIDITFNKNEEIKNFKNESYQTGNDNKSGKNYLEKISKISDSTNKNESITQRKLLSQNFFKSNILNQENSDLKPPISSKEEIINLKDINQEDKILEYLRKKKENKLISNLEGLLEPKLKYLKPNTFDYFFINCIMGIGDWGLGIGDWGLGPIPNPQSPIPNPQSPIPIKFHLLFYYVIN